MESFESTVPRGVSLDHYVQTHQASLQAVFENNRAKTGDIIDSTAEFDLNVSAFYAVAEAASPYLAREDETEQATDAIYRSIHFATQLTDCALNGDSSYDLNAYLDQLDSFDEAVLDSQTYLQARPALDNLIAQYVDEVDHSGRYYHAVELFSSLTCMLVERQLGELYAISEADHATIGHFIKKPTR